MRLRLTVHRHGLPETPIIWVVDTSAAPTIYRLLEQVNETIPIESDGEWGLEDYAVEIKGCNGVNYECLHFQPVSSVMKEEDEVIIRPLLTHDLKIRRISGRHQISSNGKHLVDGLALGRPLLRRPIDRPAISIPPRKKRRITLNDDEDEESSFAALEDVQAEDFEESSDRQLVLHADFDDEDSEDDDDFAPDQDDSADDDDVDDSDEEMEDMKGFEKQQPENESSSSDSNDDSASEIDEAANNKALQSVSDPEIRANIRKLHSAFPESEMAVCKYILQGTNGNMGQAYDALNGGFTARKPRSSFTETLEGPGKILVKMTRYDEAAQAVNVTDSAELQEERDETPNPLVNYYDQNGLPPGSITSGKALTFMAQALQGSPSHLESRGLAPVANAKRVRLTPNGGYGVGLTSTPVIDKATQEETSHDSSEDSSEEDSSSSSEGNSSGDSEDESDVEADGESQGSSSADSDDDSSSDSSSENDEPEEVSSKLGLADDTNASASAIADVKNEAREVKDLPPTTPGEGKKATKARNQRRRVANVLQRFKEKGIVPAGTTVNEFAMLGKLNLNEHTSSEEASALLQQVRLSMVSNDEQQARSQASNRSRDFESRRQGLLASLASGGIEVDAAPVENLIAAHLTSSHDLSVGTPLAEPINLLTNHATSPPPHHDPLGLVPNNQGSKAVDVDVANSPLGRASPIADAPNPSPIPLAELTEPSASTRRARLDVGAGRRLLFGALGIKAPRTKIDEEKVRNTLMKDIRPIKAIKELDFEQKSESEDTDPDAWRQKINYRAVECVQEGVELSEPPFPFYQRWDPQQQTSWSQYGDRGGKRKKDQRDQPQFYEESPQASKKQKRRKGKHVYAEERAYLEASYEPSQDNNLISAPSVESHESADLQIGEVEREVSQQLMREIQRPADQVTGVPEDLIPLPENLSTLSDLIKVHLKPGIIIAFKRLEMSAATHWQPRVSAYQTARVVAVENDQLQIMLAIRDRRQRTKEYDEKTGERIFDRFDVPCDEDIEEEDGGILDISFSELIEPKLVKDSLIVDCDDDTPCEIAHFKEGSGTDDSKTLSQEEAAQEVTEAQLSHVTETPVSSEVPQSVPEAGSSHGFINNSLTPEREASFNQLQRIDANVAEFSGSSISKHGAVHTSAQSSEAISLDMDELIENASSGVPTTEVVSWKHAAPIAEGELGDTEMGESADPATLENQEEISLLMRDAGFRSSIPSSIMKSIGFGVSEIATTSDVSAGDGAVFDKLLHEKIALSSPRAYSPKFYGLGSSSPVKQILEITVEDQQFNKSANASDHAQWPSSPFGPFQSSWATVNSDYELSSSLPATQPERASSFAEADNGSSWITDDEDDVPLTPHVVDRQATPRQESARKAASREVTPRNCTPKNWSPRNPTQSIETHQEVAPPVVHRAVLSPHRHTHRDESPPVKKSRRPTSKVNIPVRKVPESKAMALWEKLRPKTRRASTSSVSSIESSPLPDVSNHIAEGNPAPIVTYPQLSVGSSFTSDHGRQPDFDYDNTAAINAQASNADMNRPSELAPEPNTEIPTSPCRSSNFSSDSKYSSDEEPQLPAPNKYDLRYSSHVENDEANEEDEEDEADEADEEDEGEDSGDDDDDDADAPSSYDTPAPLASPSQPNTIKRELSSQSIIKDMSNVGPKIPQIVLEDSEDSDVLPLNASQNHQGVPQSQRMTNKAAVRQASVPAASQIKPSQSQMIDLTMSSDVEPEESDDAKPRSAFKSYNLVESDDNDDYLGWMPKAKNGLKGLGSRRSTGSGLKDSSAAQNRRKTSSQ